MSRRERYLEHPERTSSREGCYEESATAESRQRRKAHILKAASMDSRPREELSE
ncbi:MAG: hypothetical protein JRN23_04315 [Nitrososphaerota archaeon]|nr:hypothetical protein [Nitrososphaerota archaeon]